MTTVSWPLLRNPRVPIFANLTLNVSSTGSDTLGDYTGVAFRQIQAAIDYVSSSLDFRVPATVTINVAAGTYNAVRFAVSVENTYSITIAGAGAGTILPYIQSETQCNLYLQNLTLTGAGAAIAALTSVSGARVSVFGTLWLNPQATQPIVYSGINSAAAFSSATVNFAAGNYLHMFYTEASAYTGIDNSTINFASGCNVSVGVAVARNASAINILPNNTFTGQATGPAYLAPMGGIISGATLIPATVAGTTQPGGFVS